MNPPIATTPDIDDALAINSPVAMGVSGGKDSTALAFATVEYLDSISHKGPRILIHSDLGRVEWKDSAPTCERLATALGLELVTVRRQSGDMMDRWLTRWSNNVARYQNLECVKIILPWSTASMRFCTSELKTAIICRELVRRFPGQTILSASGIRRQESPNRAKAPIAKPNNKLTSKTWQTTGLDWHPIIEWLLSQVLALHEAKGFCLHEAYTTFGTSRVSCVWCILGNKADFLAAARCADNHDLYREMVNLEIDSAFSFQDSGWLGDVAPHLLSGAQLEGLRLAKIIMREREHLESRIPKHLLYTKGWPTCIPTAAEAEMLCGVRRGVAELMGFAVEYTEPDALIGRYEALMAEQRAAA